MTNVVDELSKKYNETKIDDKLINIRNKNHKLYYMIDINFLQNIDLKYKNQAIEILNRYNNINSDNILICNYEESSLLYNYLTKINTDIKKLKEILRSDLETVIDYVDRIYDKIDISLISKDSPLGILIVNKYDSFKVYSANLDLSNLNDAMKRQSKRLIYLKELDYLISNYKNMNTKYNKENTRVFINNLYEIVGKYLFLLTTNEFEYTKEAIKKILSYKYDFIDKYLPTYKIILTKIWNSNFTEDYYFICELDLSNDSIYLMNDINITKYEESGYICDIPKNFIRYFNLSNDDIMQFPLPCNLNDSYKICNNNHVNLKAVYTTNDKTDFKSILPVVYINKNNNHK